MTALRVLVLALQAAAAVMLVRRLLGPGTTLSAARWPLGFALFAGTLSAGGALSHVAEWRTPAGITGSHLAVLGVLLGILIVVRRPVQVAQPQTPAPTGNDQPAPPWADRVLIFATLIAVALVLTGAVLHVLHNPNGGYDAWAMWNGKGDVLAHDRGSLSGLVESLSSQGHSEYPLLLPLVLATGFELCGPRVLEVSMAVTAAFGVATFGLLWLGLRSLKGWRFAALGILCAVGSMHFPMYAFHQYADVPLALYFLAAAVVITDGLRRSQPPSGPFVLAGVMLGCAAWTKNEGNLMLLAAFVAGVPALLWWRGARAAAPLLAALALGAAPFLVLTIGFKSLIQQPNDLVAGWQSETLDHLLNPMRYWEVLYFGWKLLGDWGLGIGALLLIGFFVFAEQPVRRRQDPSRPAARWLAGALAITIAGYFFVFVTTPFDLDFHLETAMDRLVCQVWPALLFAVLLTRGDDLFARLPGTAAPGRPAIDSVVPPVVVDRDRARSG